MCNKVILLAIILYTFFFFKVTMNDLYLHTCQSLYIHTQYLYIHTQSLIKLTSALSFTIVKCALVRGLTNNSSFPANCHFQQLAKQQRSKQPINSQLTKSRPTSSVFSFKKPIHLGQNRQEKTIAIYISSFHTLHLFINFINIVSINNTNIFSWLLLPLYSTCASLWRCCIIDGLID